MNRPHRAIELRRRCRGGVLLEVVLSIALFGGAAAFALAAVRSVFITLDTTRRQQEAIDLARTKIAELEAGIINLADLRSGETSDFAAEPGPGPKWTFDLKTQRSPFHGLTLVELTVTEAAGAQANLMTFTLRQLVNLRPEQGEVADEEPAPAATPATASPQKRPNDALGAKGRP